jgi:hypothetical protein
VYENVAAAHGARSFQRPDAVWDAMSRTERWAANQAFLDELITDNAQIRILVPEHLHNNWDEWITTGMPNASTGDIQNYYLRKEILYLMNRGYTNIVREVVP